MCPSTAGMAAIVIQKPVCTNALTWWLPSWNRALSSWRGWDGCRGKRSFSGNARYSAWCQLLKLPSELWVIYTSFLFFFILTHPLNPCPASMSPLVRVYRSCLKISFVSWLRKLTPLQQHEDLGCKPRANTLHVQGIHDTHPDPSAPVDLNINGKSTRTCRYIRRAK